MLSIWVALQSAYNSERGATTVEYAAVVLLIVLVFFGAAYWLGQLASATFTEVGTELGNAL